MADRIQSPGSLRVFLSYASQDADGARLIADALTAAGIEAWFDQSELRGGDAWDQKIRRQIRECQLFVPVISGNTQTRAEGYFRLEWHLAEQRSFLMAQDQPFIVPVVIDGTSEIAARVPDRFRERQWTRLPGGQGASEFATRLLGLAGVAVSAAPAGGAAIRPIPAARSDRSVAVLAFANLSADRENEYFSDGISDELLTLLQGIRGLRVAARTSAFSFKGKADTAEEIGERLGVSNLVEGSVQRSGSKVKISARLSSTGGEVRWSRSFTREMSDVFALQEEIAAAIVGELKGHLSSESEVAVQVHAAARGGTRNPVAYEHYLIGRHYFGLNSDAGASRAVDEFKKAIVVDSEFALAWSQLGRAYTWQTGYGTMDRVTFDATLKAARAAAERALALDPGHVQGLTLLAWLDFAFEYQIPPARARIVEVLAHAPSDPEVLIIAASITYVSGSPVESLELVRRAVSLDPVNARARTQLSLSLLRAGEYSAALAEAVRVRELSPASIFAKTLEPFILLAAGRLDEAERALDPAATDWSTLWIRALTQGLQGRTAEAHANAAELARLYGGVAAVQLATVYGTLADADETFEWIERARRQRDPGLLAMAGVKYFDAVRSDPRWKAFWAQFGLSGDSTW
jgi:TolB-like protein/tetratricopeptide (TPR) repeat protein